MSSMPWVKLYIEMLDDPKMGRLTDSIKWRFVSLILLAGECDQDGALIIGDTPMSEDDIAWRLRVTRDSLVTDLRLLGESQIVLLDPDDHAYYLPKFSERQGRPQNEKRKKWRDRKAKQRETEKLREDVTQESRVSHASREEKSKSKTIGAEKAPRPRDPIFDAIAQVCGVDPATAGSSIAKVESVLKKSSPPYTPEEILKFGSDWPAWKDKPPTLWQLKEQIGIVRNGNGQHADDDRSSIAGYKVIK